VGLLAVGLAALLAGPAPAQPGRGFGGPGMLLRNKSVQEELKLDKDQIDKAGEALKKLGDDHKDDIAKLRDQNTSQEDKDAIRKKLAEETEKIEKDVLKPEQIKRLKQIQLQMRGVGAFQEEDVQKELKLTAEQKDDIKTIAGDVQKQVDDIRKETGRDFSKFPDMMKKTREVNKDGLEKVNKVLNDDQKKNWKEMPREPFEVKFEFRAPGQ